MGTCPLYTDIHHCSRLCPLTWHLSYFPAQTTKRLDLPRAKVTRHCPRTSSMISVIPGSSWMVAVLDACDMLESPSRLKPVRDNSSGTSSSLKVVLAKGIVGWWSLKRIYLLLETFGFSINDLPPREKNFYSSEQIFKRVPFYKNWALNKKYIICFALHFFLCIGNLSQSLGK
jgi:hypothetical protein